MGKRRISSQKPIYELPPEGETQAVVYGVAYLGMQTSYWGALIASAPTIGLAYETAHKNKDGKAHCVTENIPLNSSQLSGFTARRLALGLPEDCELSDLVGRNLLINIKHNQGRLGGIFANIDKVASLPQGAVPLTPTATFYYDEGDDTSTPDAFYQLPKYWQKLLDTREDDVEVEEPDNG